jgi:hypothetical protein
LSLPYAFYSDLFGAAGGYVYDVAGFPQQQSTILVTAMLGSAGSGMVFVMGRDILVPGFDRLFVDPTFSVADFSGNYASPTAIPVFPINGPAATTPARTTTLREMGGTTSCARRSSTCCPSATAGNTS